MSHAWRSGSTRAWRKLRAAVLLRDGYRCRVGPDRAQRGQPDVCTTLATHAHHLDGKAAGDDPARIVASCAACNLAEGDVTKLGTDPIATPTQWWT